VAPYTTPAPRAAHGTYRTPLPDVEQAGLHFAAVAVAAFVVSVVAVLIAGLAAIYTHRGDQRAVRAEKRAQDAERVTALERIGGIMREAATTVGATATDPLARPRLDGTLARLREAIIAVDDELPACSEYARTVDLKALPAAEAELERAVGSGRHG
jgi:hypothetical protein